VPSHSGFFPNEWADRAAKRGAKHERESATLHVPLSLQEGYHLLEQTSWKKVTETYHLKERFLNRSVIKTDKARVVSHSKACSNISTARRVNSLFYRIKLNAFVTKFSRNSKCLCGENISNTHIIFECKNTKAFLPQFSENSLRSIFNNLNLAFDIAKGLWHSPIGHLL